MAKAFFTQGVAVLFRRPVTIDELRPLLERDHPILKEVASSEQWVLGGPTVILGYRPEVNGLASVDVVDRPWPDTMGDPKGDPFLFGAWSMGHFGPLTFPGNLDRAINHAWGWTEGQGLVAAHQAFARVRLSYVFGASQDALVMPEDVEPADELAFVTGIARALLDHPDAICLFNPGGELILDAHALDERVKTDAELGVPALDAWTNVRLWKREDDWILMDTVGNGQLDVPDLEAAFPRERFSPRAVDNFLRNATLYLLDTAEPVKNGDTMDGPGELRWQTWEFEESLAHPPRRVLRWLPVRPEDEWGTAPVPLDLVPEELRSDGAQTKSAAPWWKRWLR